MFRPRLIYYNDAHHYHAKRIEPPASVHKLRQPVDELAGTGADLLTLSLGYGDVYFHNSKVGRHVGQMKEVWQHFIDWRIMRMVEEGKRHGTDQLRECVARGRELGIKVYPSIKTNDPAPPGDERAGLLKYKYGAEVCLREPGPNEWYYDFSNEIVRNEKLAVIREVLEDYGADGIQLYFAGPMFRKDEVEKNIPTVNRFVADVKRLAIEVGKKQGREVGVTAHVSIAERENLAGGLDVRAWLREGSVDFITGEQRDRLLEPTVDARWLADAANAAGAAAYYRPERRIYDERSPRPTIEMYRALLTNLVEQGFSGLMLGYLPWPFATEEHRLLRELAHPDAFARKSKRYLLQPREGDLTPHRVLPVQMEEGKTVRVTVPVADDVESARRDKEMRQPVLTLRFSSYCIEDDIEFRFNGRVLEQEEAEISDERALGIPVQMRKGMPLDAPTGMAAHWFRFKLKRSDVKHGDNVIEIESKRHSKKAGFKRHLNGVEIHMRYTEYVRPEGFDMERVDAYTG